MEKDRSEYEYAKELLHLMHRGVSPEYLLSEKTVFGELPAHDEEYMKILEAKARELYETLYNDPLNFTQRFYPWSWDQLGDISKQWWLELVFRANIIKPIRSPK